MAKRKLSESQRRAWAVVEGIGDFGDQGHKGPPAPGLESSAKALAERLEEVLDDVRGRLPDPSVGVLEDLLKFLRKLHENPLD